MHAMQFALSRDTQFPRFPRFDLALGKVPVYIIGWLWPHLGFAGILVFMRTGVDCKTGSLVWRWR